MTSFVRKFILLNVLVTGIDAVPTGRRVETTTTCKDNESFLFLINDEGKTAPCTWIDTNVDDITFRRNEQCKPAIKAEVKENCQRACGECCGDNPTFEYPYDHPTYGILNVKCSIIGTFYKDTLCPIVKHACPASCGLCPTSAPTIAPTESPTAVPTEVPTAIPTEEGQGGRTTPQLGGSSSSSGGLTFDTPSPSVEAISPTAELDLFFAAEIYTKDDTIESISDVVILEKINEFFDREMEGYENHKIFTSMSNAGIQNIDFTFLAINKPFEDHLMQCPKDKPDAYSKSVCSTAVGTAKITYLKESVRKLRRLDDVGTIENKVEGILLKHSGAVAAMIDNVDGLNLVNTATDLPSLIDTTPSIASLDEINKNVAKIVVPIVVVVILVVLILGAYIVHRRRKNSIVVELEETMDVEDDRLLSEKGRRNEKQSRDMLFPVVEVEDAEANFVDYICGSDERDTKS